VNSLPLIPINDLKSGWAATLPEVKEKVLEVLESGYWVHGENHRAFEVELSKFLGVDEIIGVASGTDALKIAMLAIGCSSGSKIISVANAGGYTAVAAASIGCEVIFCDIDPKTMLLDPNELKSIISRDIAAVVVTHLYGNIAPIAELVSICKDFGVPVIEDCAQAIGGSFGGQRVGSFGDIAAFSFYPTKNLGAIGDAGAVATSNPIFALKARQLRQYGWLEKYSIQIPSGMNSRLDEVQAAVLRIGLNLIEDLNQSRLNILSEYWDSLNRNICIPITSTKLGNVGHLAVIEFESQKVRDNSRSNFHKLGIQTEIHYPFLDTHQPGLSFQSQVNSLKNSIDATSRILTVPLFPHMTNNQIQRVCAALSA
jgi:dTDP-4-amino-4,6-dideoxygalactose transaminase